MKNLLIFALGIAFVFAAGVCLVSWVSECHLNREPLCNSMWVIMDPPLMSLYLSVPGFFASCLSAVYTFAQGN